MTVEEFNKMCQDIEKEYREKIEHNWKLWEQKESDRSKYNDLMKHKKEDISDDFKYGTLETIKMYIEEAEEYSDQRFQINLNQSQQHMLKL